MSALQLVTPLNACHNRLAQPIRQLAQRQQRQHWGSRRARSTDDDWWSCHTNHSHCCCCCCCCHCCCCWRWFCCVNWDYEQVPIPWHQVDLPHRPIHLRTNDATSRCPPSAADARGNCGKRSGGGSGRETCLTIDSAIFHSPRFAYRSNLRSLVASGNSYRSKRPRLWPLVSIAAAGGARLPLVQPREYWNVWPMHAIDRVNRKRGNSSRRNILAEVDRSGCRNCE